MGEQRDGTMQVVLRIARRDGLQVADRGFEIAQVNLGDAATVDRIELVGARPNGLVVALAGALEVAGIEIQVGQLLVVPD